MGFVSLIRIVTPPRGTLVLIAGLLLIQNAIALTYPWLAGRLTGALLDLDSGWTLPIGAILGAWLGLAVLRNVFSVFSAYLMGSTAQNMAASLRSRIFEHMHVLPMSYFQQASTSDVLSLLSNDARLVSNFVTNTLVGILPAVLQFVGAATMIAWLNFRLAIVVIVLVPAWVVAVMLLGRRIRPAAREAVHAWSHMAGLVQENLGLLPAIKAFGREPVERRRFDERNRSLVGASVRQTMLQALLGPAINVCSALGIVALIWLGALQLDSSHFTVAELVTLLLYAAMLIGPLAQVGSSYGQAIATFGASGRLREFFAVNPEPISEGLPPLENVRGEIEFRGVSFAYPGRPPVFENLDLHIAAGETIAILGPNGAGKSTLAHLLLRLHDPDDGTIKIDGTDIREVDMRSLRDQVGIVAQNTLLMNATVADNIGYGKPGADLEQIEVAARRAGAHDFVQKLPEGYETVIGDQGLRLSGGQRQRLSLARTLMNSPAILILDEATSMFDPAGEASFIRECASVFENRTVILITHEPRSVALADRVFRLENGRLTLSGSPAITGF